MTDRHVRRPAWLLLAALALVVALSGTPARAAAATVDEAAARITVPAGFSVQTIAQGLNGPRLMTFGPDGALYVSLTGAGEIAQLRDTDGDGRSDRMHVVAAGMRLPHGLEWHDGALYVAESGRIERWSRADADGVFTQRTLVTDNVPSGGVHVTRTLHFGPDGMLYLSAGSSCNLCDEADPRRAAILRFTPQGGIPPDNPFAGDPDPRRQAVWAWGLRNAVDFTWTPDGRLWAGFNGSDGLGDARPPEAVVVEVRRGGFYGWPYCYTPGLGANTSPQTRAQVRDTRLKPPPGFSCEQATPALFTDLAHSAPLGMALAAGSGFPAAYQSDLFVAYHGSWNTSGTNQRDCKVERIVVQDGQPVHGESFARGWKRPGRACAAAWGRPAGLTFGPDGAMYVSDDLDGRIYRIAWTGEAN